MSHLQSNRLHSNKDRSNYLSTDTIAAVATPVGGAISIVRVSGPHAFSSLEALTHSAHASKSEPRKLCLSNLHHTNGDKLDQALFVRFVSPDSYTGEDLVEYHLHGSTFIAQQIMECLLTAGIRQALPGEFSFRSVRNGKMSLFQAQAVADLIGASNSGAVSLALEKLSGNQNKLLTELGGRLRKLVALGEVGIDFSDQDVDEVSLPRLKLAIPSLIETLENLQSTFSRGTKLQAGVKVAFVGLPNVGKSSFFNALLGENRSIVSDIPGTTRDVISETITLRGRTNNLTLRLEDTAGLRSTPNPIEKLGIERTHESAQNADLLLFLVDSTQTAETSLEEWKNLRNAKSNSLASKTIGIFTKTDLVSQEQLNSLSKSLKPIGIERWVATSSVSGYGVSDAIEAIISLGSEWTHRTPGEILLTRLDHFNAVIEAATHLKRAQGTPEIDLFASDLRQSLHALAPLIGETMPDDILGQIFSEFCIGK